MIPSISYQRSERIENIRHSISKTTKYIMNSNNIHNEKKKIPIHQNQPFSFSSCPALLNLSNPDTDSPFVRIQALNSCKLFDCAGKTNQSLCGEIGAGDVLDKRAEVDAGVLLGVAVGCYRKKKISYTFLRNTGGIGKRRQMGSDGNSKGTETYAKND